MYFPLLKWKILSCLPGACRGLYWHLVVCLGFQAKFSIKKEAWATCNTLKKGASKNDKGHSQMTYGWTNSIQARKCIPHDDRSVYQVRNLQSWTLSIPWQNFPFLDLRLEGPCFAVLPRFARLDNCYARSFLPTISERKSTASEK